MGGTQKPFVQEKKNGHDALFHCYCWLSNEDDEKLGDTKWAGTHLSSAMKSTTPPSYQCHSNPPPHTHTHWASLWYVCSVFFK